MGFHLRKAFRAGSIRFNLSKSGFGASAGVTGARVGLSSQGRAHVHGGRGGLYYRKSLGSVSGRARGWKASATAACAGVAVVWAVSLYGLFVDDRLVYALAVVPRRFDGLSGVLGSPLVHGSFAHLVANSVPLLILGGMVAGRGAVYYLTTTLAVAVLGGLGLWVFGRSAAHIGASGLIFGYFGFLVGRGYYERSLSSVAVAIVVAVVYGGMIAGVLPRDDGVSWEAHLFGLLAGALCARAAGRAG